jgi:hypothetical protein
MKAEVNVDTLRRAWDSALDKARQQHCACSLGSPLTLAEAASIMKSCNAAAAASENTRGNISVTMAAFVRKVLQSEGREHSGLQICRGVPALAAQARTHRILAHPARKALLPPSNFDWDEAAQLAATVPATLELEHANGYESIRASARNIFLTRGLRMVHFAAALGVVTDLSDAGFAPARSRTYAASSACENADGPFGHLAQNSDFGACGGPLVLNSAGGMGPPGRALQVPTKPCSTGSEPQRQLDDCEAAECGCSTASHAVSEVLEGLLVDIEGSGGSIREATQQPAPVPRLFAAEVPCPKKRSENSPACHYEAEEVLTELVEQVVGDLKCSAPLCPDSCCSEASAVLDGLVSHVCEHAQLSASVEEEGCQHASEGLCIESGTKEDTDDRLNASPTFSRFAEMSKRQDGNVEQTNNQDNSQPQLTGTEATSCGSRTQVLGIKEPAKRTTRDASAPTLQLDQVVPTVLVNSLEGAESPATRSSSPKLQVEQPASKHGPSPQWTDEVSKQSFFRGHDDDVLCLTVSTDGMIAATGQVLLAR